MLMLSPKAKQIRILYRLNKITVVGMKMLYNKGEITEDEYTEIVGKNPTEENTSTTEDASTTD